MKSAAILLVTLGLLSAGAAGASDKISDLDYLKATRCKGLATGLGSGDTAALDAMLKTQGRSRSDALLQRATEEMDRARHEAAKSDLKDRLSAELSGPCVAYMSGGKEMAGGR